jgi:hypothetical protein
MFSRESLTRQWKTIPPLGVLALCLIYAMFALRVLIVIAPFIGEMDTNYWFFFRASAARCFFSGESDA